VFRCSYSAGITFRRKVTSLWLSFLFHIRAERLNSGFAKHIFIAFLSPHRKYRPSSPGSTALSLCHLLYGIAYLRKHIENYGIILVGTVYSPCRLCQQIQTLNLLVVVQGQCTMGCAADESGMKGGFPAP
jgi:hypothetical protein